MPSDPRVSYGTAGLVRNQHGEVLMLYRKGTPHAPNVWSIPGGWVDFGESPAQALVRELKEEVGLDIDVSRLRFSHYVSSTFNTPLKDNQAITLYFEVRGPVSHPDPRNMEPGKHDLAWVHPVKVFDGRPLFHGLPYSLRKMLFADKLSILEWRQLEVLTSEESFEIQRDELQPYAPCTAALLRLIDLGLAAEAGSNTDVFKACSTDLGTRLVLDSEARWL